jgi:hypothetical protein
MKLWGLYFYSREPTWNQIFELFYNFPKFDQGSTNFEWIQIWFE